MPSARITLTAALLLTPLASACALLPGHERPTVSTAGMPGALEPIHAAAFTNDLVVFRVSSNGCTERDDITPIVTRPAAREDAVITLRRIAEDDCTTASLDGVELIWSFEELGLEPGETVEVNNPYMITDGVVAPNT
jgi:hypothetical protein